MPDEKKPDTQVTSAEKPKMALICTEGKSEDELVRDILDACREIGLAVIDDEDETK